VKDELQKKRVFRPDHLQRFEDHLKQIQLSKKDDFVIDSMKLTFFAGWAAAMDSLNQTWFETKAANIKEELQGAIDRLQALEAARQSPLNSDLDLDFNFPDDEKVNVSYEDFNIK
jgi:hypothetical protein